MGSRRGFLKSLTASVLSGAAISVSTVSEAKPSQPKILVPDEDLPDGYYCHLRKATLHRDDTKDWSRREWIGDHGYTTSIRYDFYEGIRKGPRRGPSM